MRMLPNSGWTIGTVVVSVTAVISLVLGGGVPRALFAGVADAQSVASGPCGLNQTALCETFDQPAGIGNRSGQLNGTLWGVSRAIGGSGTNFGQQEYNAWSPTQMQACGGTTTVQPDNDVIICNGQVREAVNDNDDVITLAMYAKQPFDFAGRTGIVAFDVSNDTLGTHTEWPEFWLTDQPVPTPFTHFGSWLAAPRNGLGLRFAAATQPFQGYNIAPACPNDQFERWSMDSAVVSRNYVIDDQANGGAIHSQMLDCVIGSSGPGNMNHVELHISQNQIDAYATDAGTTAPLKHIAVVQNANLTFTRGLVWLEDVHYNAAKFGGQTQHTFSWDNMGFDGPVLARDLAFDAPDALTPVAGYPGKINLGYSSLPGNGPQLTVPNVTGIQNAAAGLLTFNFFHYDAPSTITYVVNGHSHSVAWPYPDQSFLSWRTLAVPVPLSEVVAGNNTVSITSDQQLVVANVDLVMVGAGGGGGSVPPPSTPAVATATSIPATPAPATATPTLVPATATATMIPAATATATPIPATATSTPTRVPPTATSVPTPQPNVQSGFTESATVSPSTVRRGSTVSIKASVTSQAASTDLVDIEVYDSTGHKMFQQWFDNQSFSAGQTRTYGVAWTVSNQTPTGTYTVKIGVFIPGWGQLLSWDDQAAQISVR